MAVALLGRSSLAVPASNDKCANDISPQGVEGPVEELPAKGKAKTMKKHSVDIVRIVLGRAFNFGKKLQRLKFLKPRMSHKILRFTPQQVFSILDSSLEWPLPPHIELATAVA